MKKHELKILPQYFQAVRNGTKTFELRKDDRDYQRGDVLVLKEWDGEKYTGSGLRVKVTYILQDAEKYGIKDGYVIMGIRRIESNADFNPMTNADRIRQMSDEKLANFLDRWEMGDVDYSKTFCNLCDGQYDCHDDCLMDWLKSPVEVDE